MAIKNPHNKPPRWPPLATPVMPGDKVSPVIMVIFMLITITGETLSPGMTGVANGGHLGGLLCGFLMAILWPVSYRGKHDA
jgi:membrane associated rhomboid family serine protease